ncbi:MAG: hypothetical protein FJ057_00165 [Cyanobacteria bacterium K_DeepCast_0m_m1_088]|nr:hypothetical protein [Cyanobacteria bacterium K_DeepCast_0m_m1_088]
MAGAWVVKAGAAGLELRCRHPRPVRALIDQLSLHWADGQQQRIERPSGQRGRALAINLAEGRCEPERIEARLDLARELDGLQRLTPSGDALRGWLQSLRRRSRRWRGLVLAASCGDPALTVGPSYDSTVLPLLLRLALLEPEHDPALAVLMAFSRKGRQLHGWLQLLGAASGDDLALLRLPELDTLGRQERLLALEQLAARAARATPLVAPSTVEPLPLLQYWEGTPVPADVEAMLQAWPALLPELQPLRLDASRGLAWIRSHGEAGEGDAGGGDGGDAQRFQRCWHPAMQSDFLRVLRVAREGGLYLDCDTPTPDAPDAVERWRGLAQNCWSSRTLALCVNAVRQPGDCRHYVVNCCLWAPPGHPLLQRWLAAYRHTLDTLPNALVGTPKGIHRLGPELVSHLVDELLADPQTRLDPVDWQGLRLSQLEWQGWRLLLLPTQAYRQLFGVPFSCHASYQSCNDPRDWKLGVRP